MRILGIESTCDETAASVVEDGVIVRSNVVASQVDLHAVYAGVVPEIASRAHVQAIMPVIKQALDEADASFQQIHAIAVAHRPGLIGSLLVGLSAAKTLAWSLGLPLIGVDHVAAHLYASRLHTTDTHPPSEPKLPAIGLVCSGGHTALYLVRSFSDIHCIGRTIDDAVGEAYDKVSAILGLGYPGGPVLDRLASLGDPNAIHFPRSLLARDSLNFSFSGLKTSVLYHVRGPTGRERDASSLSQTDRNNVIASFQQSCIDTILTKLRRAVDQANAQGNPAQSLIVGGGVSANRGLRAALPSLGLPVHLPAMPYCTDNAAMIAGLGHHLLSTGHQGSLNLDASPMSAIP